MLHHPRMLESLGNDISEHERGFERARNSDKEVRSSAQDCLLLRPLVPTLYAKSQGFSNYENWWFTGVKDGEQRRGSELLEAGASFDSDYVRKLRADKNARRRNPAPDATARVKRGWFNPAHTRTPSLASPVRTSKSANGPRRRPSRKQHKHTPTQPDASHVSDSPATATAGTGTGTSPGAEVEQQLPAVDGSQGSDVQGSDTPAAEKAATSPPVASTPTKPRPASAEAGQSAPPLLVESLWSPLNEYAATTTMNAGRSVGKGAHINPWARDPDAKPKRWVSCPL